VAAHCGAYHNDIAILAEALLLLGIRAKNWIQINAGISRLPGAAAKEGLVASEQIRPTDP
jgi:hypothetical protein